jgi:hypothetical protein
MRSFILFKTLMGIPLNVQLRWQENDASSESNHIGFLAEGHVVEYIEYGDDRKKVVSMFYGPQEFIVPCHPVFSTLSCLDDGVVEQLSHKNIMLMLRKFPESRNHYREIRKLHVQKVQRRLKMINEMTPEQRFWALKKDQPWVFSLVDNDSIASYLGVSIPMLKQLKVKINSPAQSM